MIDHMLVNLKKYYEGIEPNYIGKKIHMPDGVGLTPYWVSDDYNSIVIEDGRGSEPIVPKSKIIGLYNVSDMEKYVIARWTNTSNADVSAMFSVNKIFENGGVLASHLTHLYQAFKRAFTTTREAMRA